MVKKQKELDDRIHALEVSLEILTRAHNQHTHDVVIPKEAFEVAAGWCVVSKTIHQRFKVG